MINKKYIKLLRSRRRSRENNFIYKIIAKRIIDSLDILNIKVSNVLELGINENVVYNYLRRRFLNLRIDRSEFYPIKKKNNNNHKFLDLENILKFIFESLNTNGVFICVIPNKQNMFQLANSMYESDQLLYNGVFKRFNSTFEINDILSILKKLNYDTPSIYCDTINIDYDKFEVLLDDIRLMDLSYCHKDKKQSFEKRSYFKTVEYFYRKNYFEEKFLLDIKINIITAWKK